MRGLGSNGSILAFVGAASPLPHALPQQSCRRRARWCCSKQYVSSEDAAAESADSRSSLELACDCMPALLGPTLLPGRHMQPTDPRKTLFECDDDVNSGFSGTSQGEQQQLSFHMPAVEVGLV